jgi:ferredoxin-NADP reductase
VLNASKICFPDYAGNNHYNTIGNLMVDPRIGMLFVDFATGSLLQLTGRAMIDWESPAVAEEPGAKRLITIDIEAVIELPSALALRWEDEAEAVRTLRLVEKIQESEDVTSFVLEARDGGPLPGFKAGQHLPVEFNEPDMAEPVRRTYSLSGSPQVGQYWNSAKREPMGLASRHLHDRIEPDAFINAGKPAGDFVIPDGDAPMVLISAGVGITPMVSMLHALAAEGSKRDVLFLHGARDGAHLPLAQEVRDIAAGSPNVRVHTTLSHPRKRDRLGARHEGEGRIGTTLLKDLGTGPDANYMICGPVGFMADVQTALQDLGISEAHIHTEVFGPAG